MIVVLRCRRCKNPEIIVDMWGQFWCIHCAKELKLYDVMFTTWNPAGKHLCTDCHGYGYVTTEGKTIKSLNVEERLVLTLKPCETCDGKGEIDD